MKKAASRENIAMSEDMAYSGTLGLVHDSRGHD